MYVPRKHAHFREASRRLDAPDVTEYAPAASYGECVTELDIHCIQFVAGLSKVYSLFLLLFILPLMILSTWPEMFSLSISVCICVLIFIKIPSK